MTKKRNAIVVGGSMGGLLAALYLKKSGFDVDVFERSNGFLSSRGAGIVSHPALETKLASLGIRAPQDLGFVTRDRKFIAANGSISNSFVRDQIHFSWNKLYNTLLELLGRDRYNLSHELLSATHSNEFASATFANGRVIEADLLIGADGLGSKIRQQHAPEVKPAYVDYVGWRGIVEARALSEEIHHQIEHTFVMATPGTEQFVAYPVMNELDGALAKYYNFVWYRPAPADTILLDLLTDSNGFTHAMGIPPPLIRRELIEQMKRDADKILPRQLAAIVQATDQPFLQSIYDLTATQLVFGRNVLLGDAAFVARPHVGAGVTKAANDAEVLGQCLTGIADIGEALVKYEKLRLKQGHQIVEQARRLGRALTGGRGIGPTELLNETAWLSFLEDDEVADSANSKYLNWSDELKIDIAKNAFNPCVGSNLVSETDRVRVWHLILKPGERTPFHRHVLDYFWTCHSEGSAISYHEDGSIIATDYQPGDTKHMNYPSGQYLLHALENTGMSDLVFTTVEFKCSANDPLPVKS